MNKEAPVGVITGASRGIGRAVAKAIAADGYRVLLISRSERDLNDLAGEINDMTSREAAYPVPLDLSKRDGLSGKIAELGANYGRIDLLFNNAGLFLPGTADLDIDGWDELFAVNFFAPLALIQGALPFLEKSAGCVINLSSIAGNTPFQGSGAYAATKAALNAMSHSLYLELAPKGVRVVRICPSWVDTAMGKAASFEDSLKIKPEDIAETVRYILALSPSALVPEIKIQCLGVPR